MHFSADIGFSAALTADRYTDPVDCRELKGFRFAISGANTGTPVGVFNVQISEDWEKVRTDRLRGLYGTVNETAQWVTVTLPAGSVHGLAAGQTFSGPATNVTWDGANAINIWISLLDGGVFARLFWDRTSGGTANTPDVRAATRSR